MGRERSGTSPGIWEAEWSASLSLITDHSWGIKLTQMTSQVSPVDDVDLSAFVNSKSVLGGFVIEITLLEAERVSGSCCGLQLGATGGTTRPFPVGLRRMVCSPVERNIPPPTRLGLASMRAFCASLNPRGGVDEEGEGVDRFSSFGIAGAGVAESTISMGIRRRFGRVDGWA
jgi:hypothetical protein